MNLITIGDFYRNRFGRKAEIIMTICIVISYLGWVAAQLKALGLVFYVLSNGAISSSFAPKPRMADTAITNTACRFPWSVTVRPGSP